VSGDYHRQDVLGGVSNVSLVQHVYFRRASDQDLIRNHGAEDYGTRLRKFYREANPVQSVRTEIIFALLGQGLDDLPHQVA
jgi:hypothetical protein